MTEKKIKRQLTPLSNTIYRRFGDYRFSMTLNEVDLVTSCYSRNALHVCGARLTMGVVKIVSDEDGRYADRRTETNLMYRWYTCFEMEEATRQWELFQTRPRSDFDARLMETAL